MALRSMPHCKLTAEPGIDVVGDVIGQPVFAPALFTPTQP